MKCFYVEKKNWCWAWFSSKSGNNFGSRWEKCFKFIYSFIKIPTERISVFLPLSPHWTLTTLLIRKLWRVLDITRFQLALCSLQIFATFLNWGRSLLDIEECSKVYGVKMSKCHLNTSCVNTQGSYHSSCNPTYTIGNGSICEGKFVIFRLRNLIMYVFLNVTVEHAELVIQIFVKRKHKSLSPITLRNYCHSSFYANFNHI